MGVKEVMSRLERMFWPDLPTRDCRVEFPPDEDGVQVSSALDRRGRELPDPVPMAPPVGYSSSPSLAEFVQRMIRNEVSRIAELNGQESFDEANDFDVDDDFGPDNEPTIYEAFIDQSTGRPYRAPGEPDDRGGAGGPTPAAADPGSPAAASGGDGRGAPQPPAPSTLT